MAFCIRAGILSILVVFKQADEIGSRHRQKVRKQYVGKRLGRKRKKCFMSRYPMITSKKIYYSNGNSMLIHKTNGFLCTSKRRGTLSCIHSACQAWRLDLFPLLSYRYRWLSWCGFHRQRLGENHDVRSNPIGSGETTMTIGKMIILFWRYE